MKPSEPLNAAGLIEYQEGTVVSKTIIDKPTGTITLFAFAEDQGLSEHTAPYDALVLVVDGQVDITISGKTSRVKSGELILMPANEPHGLQSGGAVQDGADDGASVGEERCG